MSSPQSSPKTNKNLRAETPLKVPRLDSLQHQLQQAKDADGQPLPLLDALLFFLDDPPPGTDDRWQKGADLCQDHGIKTSRMSVWRFYRAHILQWRREQNPSPPAPPPCAKATDRLHAQVRHLAAQRALDALHDPGLAPGHLIGILQNDNHRRKIELARTQFKDRLAVRSRLEQQQHYKRVDERIRDEKFIPAQMKFLRDSLSKLLAIPPDTTP